MKGSGVLRRNPPPIMTAKGAAEIPWFLGNGNRPKLFCWSLAILNRRAIGKFRFQKQRFAQVFTNFVRSFFHFTQLVPCREKAIQNLGFGWFIH